MPLGPTPEKARASALAFLTSTIGSGKRRWLTFCGCILLLVTFFIVLLVFKEPKSDEAKYGRLALALRLTEKFGAFNPNAYYWLPRVVRRPLHNFMAMPLHAYQKQEPLFFASGFLTNLTVTLTNASSTFTNSHPAIDNMDELQRRVDKAAPGDFLPAWLEYNYESNSITLQVTCPLRDVPLITKAFAND